MQAHAAQDAHRPRLLFVDDEQRVLNSMRIMFRRQFDLFLASHGAVAAYATVEEICVALRDVYGIYEEPAF